MATESLRTNHVYYYFFLVVEAVSKEDEERTTQTETSNRIYSRTSATPKASGASKLMTYGIILIWFFLERDFPYIKKRKEHWLLNNLGGEAVLACR